VDTPTQELEEFAQSLGFNLFGIAEATAADTFPHFEKWLDAGQAGEMAYLHKHRQARQHPKSMLQSVQSVIMLGLEYTGESGTGIAKYAQGPDYHDVIWELLDQLAEKLQELSPSCETRGVVDTAPLLERDFARRAGLGWFGKNTMLINKRKGSFFFLAALLTSVRLPAIPAHTSSHCGTCTACLDACPTDAFPEPGVLDARKCISYLTIELRGPMPVELRSGVQGWLFGCDVCQDVCPWNRRGGQAAFTRLNEPELATLDPLELLQLDEAAFRKRFRGTAFLRTKRSGLLRNAAIVLGNTADLRALPTLETAAQDSDEVIREAAKWAIEQIRSRFTQP
jgi:epoxyqueuosine reductase